VQAGIKRRAQRSTVRAIWIERCCAARSGRQVEAVTAEQAEVVGQYVTVERIAQLRTERTTANTAGQASENGTRHVAERDAERPGDSANQRTCLTSSKCSADAARNTAYCADGRTDFHGLME
jgi:hypothetical protein